MSSIHADPHGSGATPAKGGHGHDAHGAHGHNGHGQYPFLAHHFDTPTQQFDSAKLGMWLFLATEVLFFGGLFVAYVVLRNRFPEVFSYASHYLDTLLGGLNTCVLILSSLTMASAVYFAQRSKKTAMIVCLVLTLGGAVGFLVIKYFEYSHKIHENLVWGKGFYVPPHGSEEAVLLDPGGTGHAPAAEAAVASAPAAGGADAHAAVETAPGAVVEAAAAPGFVGAPAAERSAVKAPPAGPTGVSLSFNDSAAAAHPDAIADAEPQAHLEDAQMPANTHLFFAVYYAMTGLHGIHVLVGIFLISWLIVRGMKNEFNAHFYTPVDLVGLYWHIVDLIWIFLFPLFYLIH